MSHAMLPLPAVAVPHVSQLRHSITMFGFFLLYLTAAEAFMLVLSVLVGMFTVLPGGYQLRMFASVGSVLPYLLGLVLACGATLIHSNSSRQRRWQRAARARYSQLATEAAAWHWQIVGYAGDEVDCIIDILHGPRLVRLQVDRLSVRNVDHGEPALTFSRISYRLPPAADLERGPGTLTFGGEIVIQTANTDDLPPIRDQYTLTIRPIDQLS